MAVANYFSGCEGDQHYGQAIKAGAKHVLMSYLYLQKHKRDLLAERLREDPKTKFLVDSGAHTLQLNMSKEPYKSWKLADFELYLARYIAWIKKNRHNIHMAAELDIPSCLNTCTGKDPDHEFGHTVVERWRKEHFQPLEKLGLKIIYVWHGGGGLEGFEKMCAEYSYVGLPGELSSEKDFNKYITIARRYTTPIHGFAASVTGDSKLVLQSKNGRVFQQDIKSLFDSCVSFEETSPKEVYGYLPRKLSTWSLTDGLKSSFEPIAAVVKHRVKKRLYKLELRGGKTITGTEDHSFFALNRKGKLVEVKPSELSVGEHLVSSKGLPLDNTFFDVSTVLDYEFFGVWFGDGHVGLRDDKMPSSIWCSKQDQPAIQKVCRAFADRQHTNWGLSPNGREGYATHTFIAKILTKLFGRIGDEKKLDHLFCVSPAAQAAFLRGYFSADGSTKGVNRLISLSCYRRGHLETVQLLLENWDIRSGITDAGISGKGSQTWELAISDVQSRKIFAEKIGFIQEDQTKALLAKNNTAANAGCHRGLPVSLLKEPGRLYRMTNGALKSRPVYAKDRRTAEIPENFRSELLEMECEYLEIKSITLVSDTWKDVYDLSVPTTERFFANGILAHNTKQSDFRDWPWASIDSITWKTSEIYGTLIVWDEHRQKLKFEQDKTKRFKYARIMRSMGFDADAIIKDTNYKEVTRFALRSMTAMEDFYVRKYKHRIFYYELRLPHPNIIRRWKPGKVWRQWAKYTPSKNFPQHANEKDVDVIKAALRGISAIQNWEVSIITAKGPERDFLKAYFTSMLEPVLADPSTFKKELAMLTAPPNPPPIPRSLPEHYLAESNPPRLREEETITEADLDVDPLVAPLALFDLDPYSRITFRLENNKTHDTETTGKNRKKQLALQGR